MAGRRWIGALMAGACCLLTGCFEGSEEGKARLAAVKAQGEEMDRALDDVEERMLGNQAAVHLWQEMGRRHRNVSAIACENVAGHVAAMQTHLDKQEKKVSKLKRQRLQAARTEPVSARKSRQN